MRFSLTTPAAKENPVNLMRQVGYSYIPRDTNEVSFTRSLDRSGYPRFHIYLSINKEKGVITFNLHLDQKRPVYRGTTAHSGEYEGKLIEDEVKRIKNVLQKRQE